MITPAYVPMTKSKRAALHLRYDTMEDLTLELLLATEDLPLNARSVIAEIVAQGLAEQEYHDELVDHLERHAERRSLASRIEMWQAS